MSIEVKEKKDTTKLYIETCNDKIALPNYENIGYIGMNIQSAANVIIMPKETKIIPTGLKISIPEGYELQVRTTNDLLLNTPLRVSTSPIFIDNDYHGELGIIMSNTSSDMYWDSDSKTMKNVKDSMYSWYHRSINQKNNTPGIYEIKVGDIIAKIVLTKVETVEIEKVKKDMVKTLR